MGLYSQLEINGTCERPKENTHKNVIGCSWTLWLTGEKAGHLSNSYEWECVWLLLLGGPSVALCFPSLAVAWESRAGAGGGRETWPQVGETWQHYLVWAFWSCCSQSVWPLSWIPDPHPEATCRPKSIQLQPWAWRGVLTAIPEPLGTSAVYFFWHRQNKRELFHSRCCQTPSSSFKRKRGKLLWVGETYSKRTGKHVPYLCQVCICYFCRWLPRMTFHELQMKELLYKTWPKQSCI